MSDAAYSQTINVPDPIKVVCPPNLVAGQFAVTGVAASVTGGVSSPLLNGVTVTANSGNVANVLLGPTGNLVYQLEPGQSVFVAVLDLKVLFANGTVGDLISWLGN